MKNVLIHLRVLNFYCIYGTEQNSSNHFNCNEGKAVNKKNAATCYYGINTVTQRKKVDREQ